MWIILSENSTSHLHVVIAIQDKTGQYSKYAGVLITSIFENTNKNIVVHIFNDGKLTNDIKSNFLTISDIYEQEIMFHTIELPYDILDLKMIKNNFLSEAALYRLFIADELDKSISKVLYLDCDIVCNGEINKIFNIPITTSVGAVCDEGIRKNYPLFKKNMAKFDKDKYFNSGVIMFNLNEVRKKHNLLDECMRYLLEYNKDPFSDQSALNYIFKNDCTYLPKVYNMQPKRESKKDDAIIWHFCGANKPWETRFSEVDKLWWKEFILTPWGKDPEKVFEMYDKVVDSLDYALIHYPSGSKRMFFLSLIYRLKKEIFEILNNYFK